MNRPRDEEMAYRNAEAILEDTRCNDTFLKETSLNDGDVNLNTLEALLPLKKTC